MEANYKLMIDSILYSYTSFKSIENVQILFDGEKSNDFYGYNLSSPIKANRYINLEQ
ncbi:MAG: GerMN domain-containing protein [Clostridiales bacterium]|nr:GerMN domain-containing protein [Clostridiales bacterium]